MGCVKSKTGNPGGQNANCAKRMDGRWRRVGENAVLVQSEVGVAVQSCPEVNPVLLDYAHKLSEEIVTRAVQQWAEVDRRYSDIPYIECDMP